MKNYILWLFVAVSLHACNSFAQTKIEIPLWENGAPDSNGLSGNETNPWGDAVGNVSVPTLTLYLPENPNGQCVVMYPGGGYEVVCVTYEGHDMASWFCERGIAYGVLKYRMPNGHCDVPLSDAGESMRLIRQNAAKWGIDPHKVGVMGASAGGHLASTLSTHYTAETRPDFQILIYPVITMGDYTHAGSKRNLLGENPSADIVAAYSNELCVTSDTPPAFIAVSSDDTLVPPLNSVNYYLALQRCNVPAALFIYPTGEHGWGFNDTFRYKECWTLELDRWLKSLN